MRALSSILLLLLGCYLASAQSTPDPYQLRACDLIRIRIRQDARVDAEIEVGLSGAIQLPFLIPAVVTGMTLSDLERMLEVAYSRVLRIKELDVSVVVVQLAPRRFQVQRPIIAE